VVLSPNRAQVNTDDPNIFHYNSSRIRKTVKLLIALIVLALLAAPIFSMYKLSSMGTERTTHWALGMLMVFSLVFAGTMSLLATAKRHEVFAATAAYCAVLMVCIESQRDRECVSTLVSQDVSENNAVAKLPFMKK
jgi:peptidoglycan/LPS O-acetylase OafA/YrhL